MRQSIVATLGVMVAAISSGTLWAEPVRPLAQDFVVVYESPDAARIYTYSPGLCRMPEGRLIATLDLGGPGVDDLPGPKGVRLGKPGQCKVFTSDDHGRSWAHRVDLPMVYVPCPGGQIKFNIQYDAQTKLFWLLSSQPTDGMVRRDRMPKERFNLPYDERHRLQLHFSRNCVDWCFAGLMAKTDDPRQARHYATMIIDGDDLHVLSRSGDARAKSAHDGNIITFHTVRTFRELVY